jgi:hypothetical protein
MMPIKYPVYTTPKEKQTKQQQKCFVIKAEANAQQWVSMDK